MALRGLLKHALGRKLLLSTRLITTLMTLTAVTLTRTERQILCLGNPVLYLTGQGNKRQCNMGYFHGSYTFSSGLEQGEFLKDRFQYPWLPWSILYRSGWHWTHRDPLAWGLGAKAYFTVCLIGRILNLAEFKHTVYFSFRTWKLWEPQSYSITPKVKLFWIFLDWYGNWFLVIMEGFSLWGPPWQK